MVLTQAAVTAVAGLGMTLVVISGGIDLSVGSVIALVTVVAAMSLNAGVPAVLVMGLGIATGAFCGLLNGVLITTLRVVPFIITLGMLGAARGAAKGIPKWIGGQTAQGTVQPISPDAWPAWIMNLLSKLPEYQFLHLSAGLWLLVALSLFFMAVLKWSVLGRHAFAIGSSEATARLCGIRVGRTKVAIYTLCGSMVGMAGLLQFSRSSIGDPTAALGQELDVIAAVVIGGGSLSGGAGSVAGTLTGALLIQFLRAGCLSQGWPTAAQEIIIGAIIVAAAAVDRLRHRRVG
jgi:ribose transport system permease protein